MLLQPKQQQPPPPPPPQQAQQQQTQQQQQQQQQEAEALQWSRSGQVREIIDSATVAGAEGGRESTVSHMCITPDGQFMVIGSSLGGSCCRMLTYADVGWRMLTYADADVC